MKKHLRWACISLIVLTVSACRAPSPEWNGTWKLSASKSDIPGPNLTVDASGEYHIQGATGSFRCDGKEYPSGPYIKVSCVQASPSRMDITLKENGKKTDTAQWKLSPDGKQLTIQTSSVQADGSAKSKENEYVRISGSTGFSGRWRDTNPLQSHSLLLQTTLTETKLHYAFPEKAQYVDPALDGQDAPVHGAGVPSGSTMAVEQQGYWELRVTKKRNGRTLTVGSLTLSVDGHTLTETYWRPELTDIKTVLVYEK